MLFFANHQTEYNGELKAPKKYNAEDCATTMVMGNDGLKAQWEYSPGLRPGEEWDSYSAL